MYLKNAIQYFSYESSDIKNLSEFSTFRNTFLKKCKLSDSSNFYQHKYYTVQIVL